MPIDWIMIFGLFMTERLEFDIMELVDMLPTTDDGAAKLDFHEWQEPTACAASCAGMFLNASGVVRTPENSQKAIHEEIYDPHWGGDPPGGCPPERMVKFLSKFYEDVKVHENVELAKAKEWIKEDYWLATVIRDDYPDNDSSDEDGHWVILARVEDGYVMVIDPSNAERVYDEDGFVQAKLPPERPTFEKRKSYKIKIEEFKKRWWDDHGKGMIVRSMVVKVDPASLRQQIGTKTKERVH